MPTEREIVEQIEKLSSYFVEVVRKDFNVQLEFDRQSVAWVSNFIEQMRREGVREDEEEGLSSSIGAYLGEATIALYGGQWQYNAEIQEFGICFQGNRFAFPFAKARKHFRFGEVDSILAMFESIPQFLKESRGAIATPHLLLEPCTIEHLEKLIEGDREFYETFGWHVAEGFIEFPQALQFSLEVLRHGQVRPEWWMYAFVHRGDNLVIGAGGYKGTPSDRGIVEIGYGIAPHYRNRGYATEAARALIENALQHDAVSVVWAHTLPEINASSRVLQKCRMVQIDELNDPEDGKVWRWEVRKDTGN